MVSHFMDEETKTQKGQETSATQGHIARKQQNCDLTAFQLLIESFQIYLSSNKLMT